jgi:hypothetical protein
MEEKMTEIMNDVTEKATTSESCDESAGGSANNGKLSDASSGGMKRRIAYSEDLPKRLYTFFLNYKDAGAPSYSKFARSIGATLSDVESFRENEEFDRAYRECGEIRRDYLIDGALTKRYDSSFTKYLLNYEYGMDESDVSDHSLDVTIEVIE